jgi:hypothetical protein
MMMANAAERQDVSRSEDIEFGLNMGMFAEVAGWFRLDDEGLAKALETIKADIDGVEQYSASWCVQTQGGGYIAGIASSAARSES